MNFTGKMFRILTKRIFTCLFKKVGGGGGIQHFGSKIAHKKKQNKKVADNPKSC